MEVRFYASYDFLILAMVSDGLCGYIDLLSCEVVTVGLNY